MMLGWGWSFKIICNLSLGVPVDFESSNFVKSCENYNLQSRGVFHLKYILTTHLPLLTYAFLSHVNLQFYPIWFAQSSHLLTYIVGQGVYTTFSCRNLNFGMLPKVSIFFVFLLWLANKMGWLPHKKEEGKEHGKHLIKLIELTSFEVYGISILIFFTQMPKHILLWIQVYFTYI
jgi:hypothetical protein